MNPFIRLYEAPVESLTAGAYALVLIAALVASWYAAGRNLLYLQKQYQNGWRYLVPFWYMVRLTALVLVVAVDLLLVAGIIHVLTT